NPPSADAIAALESRHVKIAERRQSTFGHVLVHDVAYIIQSILDDKPDDPESIASIAAKWGPHGTPTPEAAADAAIKLKDLVAEGSEVLRERAGFTRTQIQRIMQERASNRTDSWIEALRERRLNVDEMAPEMASQTTPRE